jgi:hypothetical protein
MARSDVGDLRGTCAPDCRSSQRDAARNEAAVADVSLAVAVIAAVATGILVLTHR